MEIIKRLLALRFRISTQLFAAFGVAVAFTVAASLVAWFSLDRVGDAQAKVNEVSIPEMEAAFGVAEYSSELVSAAPRLTTSSTPREVTDVWQEISAARQQFRERLSTLEQIDRERARRIGSQVDDLEDNVITIRDKMATVFFFNRRSDTLLQEEMTALRAELEQVLIPAVDDELFYMITGRSELGAFISPYAVHFSEAEFGIYRHLTALQAETNIALQRLSSVFGIFDPALVEAQEERFESSIASIDRNMAALNNPELEERLAPLYARLEELGLAEDGVFVTLRSKLELAEEQSALLVLSQEQSTTLLAEVDELVGVAALSAEEAAQASSQAITTGLSLLLAISVISIGGALLISWLFVGRVILHRINMLSGRMREMAEGKLQEPVVVEGHDELAEMASALEVFRHNSLEAIRLNLVEELNKQLESQATELEGKNSQLESQATELEDKNTELETVLTDLQRAQDQIVMREKLAALGEVTAGVAHEIRNPLNFVKNFSEVSGELLVEMREVLEEGGDSPDVEYITEISNDLTDNLGRIVNNCERANRIVQDMLNMGRGGTNWQEIDLNTLLVEHSMLAYHSARAIDTEFQLTVEQDLGDISGQVQAIPQDLSRTFLNIVGNACQATDERRRTLAEQGVGFEGYQPTVRLQTRDMGDEVEIRIRDNGTGMPEEVAEKIFNPFFTTKPANQGTGLGLAITNDIIRQHGGTIRVESEVESHTEMIIVIPKSPPDEIREGYGAAAASAD
jgi:signal transduction histidine kinase